MHVRGALYLWAMFLFHVTWVMEHTHTHTHTHTHLHTHSLTHNTSFLGMRQSQRAKSGDLCSHSIHALARLWTSSILTQVVLPSSSRQRSALSVCLIALHQWWSCWATGHPHATTRTPVHTTAGRVVGTKVGPTRGFSRSWPMIMQYEIVSAQSTQSTSRQTRYARLVQPGIRATIAATAVMISSCQSFRMGCVL